MEKIDEYDSDADGSLKANTVSGERVLQKPPIPPVVAEGFSSGLELAASPGLEFRSFE